MGYGYSGYNTASVPCLESFEAAVQKFKSTTPIRGKQAKGAVPLGDRKKHHMASIAMPDADTVQLIYYGLPLVVWKSDNTFEVFSPAYHSPFVVGNIQNYVPSSVGFHWDRGRMCLVVKEQRFLLPQDKSFKFRNTPHSVELLDVPMEHAIRKKRGVEKKYLKDCEPFLEWMELVQSIDNAPKDPVDEMGAAMDALYKELGLMSAKEFENWTNKIDNLNVPNRWQINRNRDHLPHGGKGQYKGAKYGFHTKGCELLMDWVTGPLSENWVTAYYVLMQQQGERGYKNTNGVREWSVWLDRKSATEYLKEIILHLHSGECFVKEPLAQGEIPTKQNAEYFKVFTELL
jgi:hypothetical protein